jgi:hypothetical protein
MISSTTCCSILFGVRFAVAYDVKTQFMNILTEFGHAEVVFSPGKVKNQITVSL